MALLRRSATMAAGRGMSFCTSLQLCTSEALRRRDGLPSWISSPRPAVPQPDAGDGASRRGRASAGLRRRDLRRHHTERQTRLGWLWRQSAANSSPNSPFMAKIQRNFRAPWLPAVHALRKVPKQQALADRFPTRGTGKSNARFSEPGERSWEHGPPNSETPHRRAHPAP